MARVSANPPPPLSLFQPVEATLEPEPEPVMAPAKLKQSSPSSSLARNVSSNSSWTSTPSAAFDPLERYYKDKSRHEQIAMSVPSGVHDTAPRREPDEVSTVHQPIRSLLPDIHECTSNGSVWSVELPDENDRRAPATTSYSIERYCGDMEQLHERRAQGIAVCPPLPCLPSTSASTPDGSASPLPSSSISLGSIHFQEDSVRPEVPADLALSLKRKLDHTLQVDDKSPDSDDSLLETVERIREP